MKYLTFIFLVMVLLLETSSAQYSNYNYISECNMFMSESGNSIINTPDQLFPWAYFQTPVSNQITDVLLSPGFGWATYNGMGMVFTTNGGYNWTTISFNDTTFTTSFNPAPRPSIS